MFVELGKLDAGNDSRPAGPGRQGFPGFDGVTMPAEAAKQMGPIDRDAFVAPGEMERGRSGRTQLVDDPPRPPTEVRRGAR